MALTQVSGGGIKDGQIAAADIADGAISAQKLHSQARDETYTLGADGNNHYTSVSYTHLTLPTTPYV